MPYTVGNPPAKIKGMPRHAIEIWVAAFNAALAQYKDEGRANATAYTAVKTKYEQNEDGDWVAKESEASMKLSDENKKNLQKVLSTKIFKPMESLRETYAEIIQEAGKRNVDSLRIKKIMELCQEVLSADDPEEKKTKEALKESESVLSWLKTIEAMKTEDGVKYPIEAFAYARDPETPGNWKLRIWEDLTQKVTKKQLGAAAAALSPGGFRGQKVDIAKEDLPAVKRKIRAAYRSLDVPDEEMPRWVKEAEVRTLMSDYISLAEATVTSKGIASVVVIRPGLNSSKERYYPPEMLARDFIAFEGVKMYADHPTEEDEKQRPERSIKDWVATLKNVHVGVGGQLIGEAIIVEPWMQQKLAALRDKGMLQEMGISINAVGTATRGEIDGVKTNVIERIVRVRSVDFVTEPGAGGMVQMYEAGGVENDVDIITMETLKERRPELVKQIESASKAEIMQEVKHKVELEEKIKALETNIETLTTERDELKTKITEAEKAQRIAEAKSIIDEAISKSELPEAAKAKMVTRFTGVETADGIAEAIKAESDYIDALKETSKVKNMGPTKADSEKEREALTESFKRMHPEWTDVQVETAVSGR